MTRLISDKYRDLNAELHDREPFYGTSSPKWVNEIVHVAIASKAMTALDYGCGKARIVDAIRHHPKGIYFPDLRLYDPAIPDFAEPPEPADLVICTDVLEHIEPDCIDAVLADLKRLTLTSMFLNVATIPAKKVLADGRNAHLIQRPHQWWLSKLLPRFDLMSFQNLGGEFAAVLAAKKKETP